MVELTLTAPLPEPERLSRQPNFDASHRPTGGHQPTVKRTADKDGPDYYPTPAWATHALLDGEPDLGGLFAAELPPAVPMALPLQGSLF